MKKLNVIKKHFFFLNLRFFVKIITPHAMIKYKLIDFAPIKKSMLTYKLP